MDLLPQKIIPGSGTTIQRQLKKCGKRCRCASGDRSALHEQFYIFWRENGHQRKKYLGSRAGKLAFDNYRRNVQRISAERTEERFSLQLWRGIKVTLRNLPVQDEE